MTDLIGSITLPGGQTGTALQDKMPTADIKNPPVELGSLKPGDNLLLQAVNRGMMTSLQTNVKIALNQQLLELPLTLDLGKPMVLPADIPAEILVQVSSRTADKLTFKLVSIDNQPAEKFLSGQGNGVASEISGAVVRGESAGISLAPLKLTQLFKTVMSGVELPDNIKDTIWQNLSEWEISAGLDNKGISTSLPTGKNISDNPDITRVIGGLQKIIQRFAESLPQGKEASGLSGVLRAQFQNELNTALKPLLNLNLPATVTVKGEGQITVLSTPLGDIFPETSLKLPAGTVLQLTIRDLLPPFPLQTDFSSELQAGHKLIDGLVSPRYLLQALKPNPSAQNLLQILEPLRQDNLPLYRDIMDKIPAEGTKMVSNMISYLKAAGSGRLDDWIGMRAVEQLRTAGNEGQEVLHRLNDLLNSGQRENPVWRQVEVPFFSGGIINKIRIAVKKNQDDEENSQPRRNRKGGTRFVIDTSFSRLGNFQFDGFSLERERRFDLIIRTEKAVPQGLIAEIMRLFKTGLHQVDYVGNININVKEKFIKICEDNAETAISREGIYI